MPSIDNKVVNITFNNSGFEKAVSSTISTLQSLKDNLDFSNVKDTFSTITDSASKAFSNMTDIISSAFESSADSADVLERAVESIDLDQVNDGVQEVSVSFEALEVAAITAISNITNQLVDFATGTLNSTIGTLISDVTSGGWTRALNIENAEFALEGLGYDVELAMESCNAAVTDTAFGLDEAAMACSNLAASGVELGDDMTNALTAISGVAAQTSSSYTDIANVFTTVAGNGKLMTQQLRQLSVRGLNAAATLGQYLGYTEAEIREMVTAGEIDFETFASVMYEAFGEHAKDANSTFSGALSNMHAALKQIGAAFYEEALDPMREFVLGAREIFKAAKSYLQPAIDTLLIGLNTVVDAWLDFVDSIVTLQETYDEDGLLVSTVYQFTDACNLALHTLNVFFDALLQLGNLVGSAVLPVVSALWDVFANLGLRVFSTVVGLFNTFIQSLTILAEQSGLITAVFGGLAEVIELVANTIDNVLSGSIKELQTFLTGLGFYERSIDGIYGEFTSNSLARYLTSESSIISKIFNKLAIIFTQLKTTIENTWNNIFGDATNISRLQKIVENIGDAIWNLLSIITDFANSVLGIDLFGGLFNAAGSVVENIADIIIFLAYQLSNVIKFVTDVVKSFYEFAPVQAILHGVIDLIDWLLNAGILSGIISSVTDAFIFFGSAIETVCKAVADFIGAFFEIIDVTGIFDTVGSAISGFISFAISAFDTIKSVIDFIATAVGNVISEFVGGSGLSNALNIVGELFYGLLSVVKFVVSAIAQLVIGIKNAVTGFFELEAVQNVINFVGRLITKVKDLLGEAAGKVVEAVHNFNEWFSIEDVINTVKGAIDKLIGTVKDLVDKFLELEAVKAVINAVKKAFNKIKSVVKSVTKKVNDFFDAFFDMDFDNFAKAAEKAFDDVVDFIGGAFDAIIDVVGAVGELSAAFMDLPAVNEAIQVVQDAIDGLFEAVKNVFGGVSSSDPSDEFDEVASSSDSLQGNLWNLNDVFKAINDTLSTVYDWLRKICYDGFDVLSNGISGFVDFVAGGLSGLGEFFGGIGTSIVDFVQKGITVDSIKDFISNVFDVIYTFADSSVLGLVDLIGEILLNFADYIAEFSNKIANSDLGSLVAQGSLIYGVFQLFNTAKEFSTGFANIGVALANFSASTQKIVNGVSNAQGALKQVSLASTLKQVKNIILSITALLLVLWLLSFSDMDKLKEVVQQLFWIFVELGIFIGVVAKIGTVSKGAGILIAAVAALLLVVTICIGILTGLASLNPDGLILAVMLLAALFVGLGWMFGKAAVAGVAAGAAAPFILAIGGALFELTICLSILTALAALNPAALIEAGIALAALAAILGVTFWAYSKVGVTSLAAIPFIQAIVSAMLELAITLGILMFVCNMCNDIGELLGAFAMLIAVLVIIVGVMAACSALGAASIAAMPGLVSIAAASLLLSVTLALLSWIASAFSWEKIGDGLVLLIDVLGVLVIAFNFVGGVASTAASAIAAIAVITLCCLLLSAALVLMSLFITDVPKALIALGMISALMIVLALCMKLIGGTGSVSKSAIAALAALALIAVLLGAAISILATALEANDIDDVLKLVAAVGVLMLALAASVLLIGKAGKISVSAIVALAAILVVIALLATVLKNLMESCTDCAQAIAIAGAIAIVLATMAAVLAILSLPVFDADKMLVVAGAMDLLGLVLLEIAAALAVILEFGLTGALVACVVLEAMSETMAVMAVILVALSTLPINPASALSIVESLAVFVGGLVGLFAAIGEVITLLETFVPGLNVLDAIQLTCDALALIGEGIGNFVGNLVGGALESLFEKLANGLEKIADAVTVLIAAASSDSGDLGSLAETFGDMASIVGSIMTAANQVDIDALTNLNLLFAFLPVLGIALDAFVGSFSGEDFSVLEPVIALLDVLATIASADIDLSKVTDLPNALNGIGTAITGFSTAIKTLDNETFDQITLATACLKGIMEVLSAMPSSGGVLSSILGSADYSGFEDNLTCLGAGLVAYSKAIVGGFSSSAVTSSITPLKNLIEALGNVPSEGGLLSEVFGSSSKGVESFANNLKTIGEGLRDYAIAIAETDFEKIENSIQPLTDLISTLSTIDAEGGMMDSIFGSSAEGVGQFADNLKAIGEALADYSGAITDVSFDAISNSITPLGDLIDTLGKVDAEGGMMDSIFGSSAEGVGQFADNLDKIGKGLAKYGTDIKDTKFEAISNSIQPLTDLISCLTSLPKSGGWLEDVIGGQDFASFGTSLESLGQSLATYSEKLTLADLGLIENSITSLQKVIDAVCGWTDFISTFKTNVNNLKPILSNLSDSIKELGGGTFGQDQVSNAINVLTVLQKLTTISSGISTLTNNKDVVPFGETLLALATDLNTIGTTYTSHATVLTFMAVIEELGGDVSSAISTVASLDYMEFKKSLYYIGQGFKTFASAAQYVANLNIDYEQFTTIGKTVAENVCNGLTDDVLPDSAVVKLLSTMATSMTNYDMSGAIDTFTSNVTDGIADKFDSNTSVADSIGHLLDSVNDKINSYQKKIKTVATDLVLYFKNGIKDGISKYQKNVIAAINGLFTDVNYGTALDTKFYNIGVSAMQGLADGMEASTVIVQQTAQQVTNELLYASRAALDIRSPSHEMEDIGMLAVLGLANGFTKYSSAAETAASKMALTTISAVRGVLDTVDENDLSPVITPVLDSSGFYKSYNSLMGNADTLRQTAGSMELYFGAKEAALTAASGSNTIVNNYDFTQNNTSPRALNREELYRQTKNQFSRFRNRVTT